MSLPRPPAKAKLLASLFGPRVDLLEEVLQRLQHVLGAVDEYGPRLLFDRTDYYAAEMGWPLERLFVTFSEPIGQDALASIKTATNRLESAYAFGDGRRQVNIDPGYITAERLILASGKNFTHRVYLSDGIYADLTLIFQKGSFRPLAWTYPDYASPEIINWLNGVRKRYLQEIRGGNKR